MSVMPEKSCGTCYRQPTPGYMNPECLSCDAQSGTYANFKPKAEGLGQRRIPIQAAPPPATGGMKFDGDKPMLALLPMEALEEVGKVLTFGAQKYDAHNWRKGFVWSRLLSAALRHTFAFVRGEDKDPETGLSHLAHAVCCLLFLISFTKTKAGTDDRYILGEPAHG